MYGSTKKMLEERYDYILERTVNGETLTALAKELGCGVGTLHTFLKEKGSLIQRGECFSCIALPDSKYIIDMFNEGTSCADIAKKLGYKPVLIACLVRKMGLKHKLGLHQHVRYNINHNIFTMIDCELKAYYLGLIAADGNINITKNNVSIDLQSPDAYILEPLRDLVCQDLSLRSYTKKNTNFSQTRLVFTSQQAVQDLAQLGIHNCKSLTIKAVCSKLPLKLQRHFVRGYFDGDGWIVKSFYQNKQHLTVGFIGTEEFLQDLWECIGLPVGSIRKDKSSPMYRLNYYGKGRMFELKEYLYSGATICLQRKFERFSW